MRRSLRAVRGAAVWGTGWIRRGFHDAIRRRHRYVLYFAAVKNAPVPISFCEPKRRYRSFCSDSQHFWLRRGQRTSKMTFSTLFLRPLHRTLLKTQHNSCKGRNESLAPQYAITFLLAILQSLRRAVEHISDFTSSSQKRKRKKSDTAEVERLSLTISHY